ncbi:hypothetical protein GOV14_06380 [Candidatus Pacearchaeota archaeon]|nr:hypothetical protein [Candidatus Pacearchaeota archaeon]
MKNRLELQGRIEDAREFFERLEHLKGRNAAVEDVKRICVAHLLIKTKSQINTQNSVLRKH